MVTKIVVLEGPKFEPLIVSVADELGVAVPGSSCETEGDSYVKV
jgi:hypothetical protein